MLVYRRVTKIFLELNKSTANGCLHPFAGSSDLNWRGFKAELGGKKHWSCQECFIHNGYFYVSRPRGWCRCELLGCWQIPCLFFLRDPFHVIPQHRFFAPKRFSKNHGMLIFTAVGNLELEHYMGNSGFFGFCVKLCRRFWSMPVVVGTGKPLASHRAL